MAISWLAKCPKWRGCVYEQAFRPTYRLLAYCLAAGGFPVPNDLAGVDRPDLVDALLLEIYGWAGLTPPR